MIKKLSIFLGTLIFYTIAMAQNAVVYPYPYPTFTQIGGGAGVFVTAGANITLTTNGTVVTIAAAGSAGTPKILTAMRGPSETPDSIGQIGIFGNENIFYGHTTALGDWNRMWNFPAGFTSVGAINGMPSAGAGPFTIYTGGAASYCVVANTNQDPEMRIECPAAFTSGNGLGAGYYTTNLAHTMYDGVASDGNGTAVITNTDGYTIYQQDVHAWSILMVPEQSVPGNLPGYALWIMNNPQFPGAIATVNNLGSGGKNYQFIHWDGYHGLVEIPWWTDGILRPYTNAAGFSGGNYDTRWKYTARFNNTNGSTDFGGAVTMQSTLGVTGILTVPTVKGVAAGGGLWQALDSGNHVRLSFDNSNTKVSDEVGGLQLVASSAGGVVVQNAFAVTGISTLTGNLIANGTASTAPNQGLGVNYIATQTQVTNAIVNNVQSSTNPTFYGPIITNNVTYSLSTLTANNNTTNFQIDFTNSAYGTIVAGAAINFQQSTNRPDATHVRTMSLYIYPNGANRAMSVNTSWHPIGSAIDATLTNNTIGILTVNAMGTSETNVFYVWRAN
jgi:hypothetical protein